MLEEDNERHDRSRSMHHREITLADGRYMIFYTFDDDESSPDAETPGQSAAAEKDNDV